MPYQLLLRQAARASSLNPDIQAYIYNTSQFLTHEEGIWPDPHRNNVSLHEQPDYQVAAPLLLLLGDHDTPGNIKSAMLTWAQREPRSHFAVVPRDIAINSPSSGALATVNGVLFTVLGVLVLLVWRPASPSRSRKQTIGTREPDRGGMIDHKEATA